QVEAEQGDVPPRAHGHRARTGGRLPERYAVSELDGRALAGMRQLHGQQALRATDGEHEMLPRLALPDSPMGTALDLVAPAVVQLPADGSEPLLQLVAVGDGVPHGVVRSFEVAPQNHRDGVGVAAYVPGDGFQFGFLIDHRLAS